MDIKHTAKQSRDSLQQGIYAVINPFVRLMIKVGITPNMVTTVGLLGNIAAAVIFVIAGYRVATGGELDYSLVTWAGGLIIGFSLFDMLDGQVARLGDMVSRFGALYDSVLDRYCELLTLGAMSYFLITAGYTIGALITLLALIGSVMVSYVRARAEGVGIECKIGFMQRPERVVVTSLGCLACGIIGLAAPDKAEIAMYVLIGCMTIIAIFANVTAFARVNLCRRELTK